MREAGGTTPGRDGIDTPPLKRGSFFYFLCCLLWETLNSNRPPPHKSLAARRPPRLLRRISLTRKTFCSSKLSYSQQGGILNPPPTFSPMTLPLSSSLSLTYLPCPIFTNQKKKAGIIGLIQVPGVGLEKYPIRKKNILGGFFFKFVGGDSFEHSLRVTEREGKSRAVGFDFLKNDERMRQAAWICDV